MSSSISKNEKRRTVFHKISILSGKVAAVGLVCAMTVGATAAQAASGDAQFTSLFNAWERMDGPSANTQQTAAIPSRKPVDDIKLTSNFGVRSDPFNGSHRMHQGVDIPGALGTPVYATADGVVSRAQWAGGYGNLVEINHGNGLQTRYGHMSKLIAQPNQRVVRGQLIGLMGSTGRSTGSHLHYEVRIAGAAVNPVPYLEGTNYEVALAAAKSQRVAMGGPEARNRTDSE
ncbi:MAG TPA: M23 family metallopeptidase [Sphingobium sp.]|uniref:M23 family metallopeptidase n=1 Tax=Sphingobium sp. TaxID=1912891 RepID=UPI002ED0A964